MAVTLPSVYKDGTATISANGTVVAGQGTLWTKAILPGDFFGVHKGYAIRILSVDSDTQLTLANQWPGGAQTAAAYEIMLQSDNARMQETSRQLLQQLTNGNIAALSGLAGAANKVPYFTGPGALSLMDVTAAGQALLGAANATAQRTALGLGTAAVLNTGTSGASIGRLDTSNTWNQWQVFSGGAIVMDANDATAKQIRYNSAGLVKWSVLSQANTHNYNVQRYDAASGTFLDSPLSISSATGITTVTNGLAFAGTAASTTRSNLGINTTVATRTVLKALDTTIDKVAYLSESGRAGAWIWRAGDYSALIAVDTQEGMFIKANAIAATAGAWVRVYSGDINVKWFGALADGSDDQPEIQAAVNVCGALGGGFVLIPCGSYSIGSSITISKSFVRIRGDGVLATQIVPTVANMDAFVVYSGTAGTELKTNYIVDLTIISTVTINRAILVKNTYNMLIERVSIWGPHAYGIEFEKGSVAYNNTLRDVLDASATTAGLLLGANGTGDLQGIFLYNCQFSGANAGSGVLVRNCGGLVWVGGEALNKGIGLNMAPTAGNRVAGVRITDVFFDACANACASISQAGTGRVSDVIFTNTHFNASVNDAGFAINGSSSDSTLVDTIIFSACHFIINKKMGLWLQYCQKITINACNFLSNGVDGASDGIQISVGVSYVNIIGGQSGNGAGFGTNQRYGIRTDASNTNILVSGVNLTGNATGPIIDAATGTRIINCQGCTTWSRGANSIAAGASTVTFAHGMAFTPIKEDFVVTSMSDIGSDRFWVSAVDATNVTIARSSAAAVQWFFGWKVGVKGGG